uniref:UTP--glucose-1-phosphate uridylyltransferase n=1 Tax=Amphora coffeiformis TaxID=265554 RepID=A0A7S3L767_9STRA
MTSGDTNEKTIELLKYNNYFGMKESQITIVQQGAGVPALEDNDAKMCLAPGEPSLLLTKPHGHGDIHSLLHEHRVARKWKDSGIKWAVLFQDTNGLAFHTLPLMLGVSAKKNLIMNSLAVPRKAKQAIGGIAKLKNKKTGEYKTINVEYNQLDPLLRANGFPDGDVNDKETGFSPFPGNINQLLFKLDDYCLALEKSRGLMPEFVNPKYKDEKKMVFKKPTRLECMMQDFPTVLDWKEALRVGFTSISSEFCFSPVKNATVDGMALQENGTHPATAASGEADQYAAVRKIMQKIGCKIEDAPETTYLGIKVIPGPAIVLKPNFALCPAEIRQRFPHPENIKISPRSTLVVRGEKVVIKSIDLDGALIIDVKDGKECIVEGVVVENEGWTRARDTDSDKEIIKMRGYHVERKDQTLIRGDPEDKEMSPISEMKSFEDTDPNVESTTTECCIL